MAKSKIHPEFFHTLTPGFHTHLTIPGDFFSKYIGETTVEKKTAELRSDTSDKPWKVEMTGRTLSDGWKEFTVAQNFETGDVLIVRYVGDLVFQVLDLGPNYSEIPDKTPPRNKTDTQDDIGKTLLKKRMYLRTQVKDFSSDNEDYMEVPRKKKVKKKNADAESFVALVTASNLRTDTLNLPKDFTSSNDFSIKFHKIVLKDERGRSWALDLAFNKSSDTFYISRGWRNFCDDNGQTAGGLFVFKLVGNRETPVLRFCRTEPTGDTTGDTSQSDWSETSWGESVSSGLSREESYIEGMSSEDEGSSMEIEKKKYCPKGSYSSYWPCHKRFIKFTLPPDYVKIKYLSLPRAFLRENGINKPGKIYLLGKGGKKWPTNLCLRNEGTMRLGHGWKSFVEGNGLETDFTLELTWEDTTPVLSLCSAESSRDREQEEFLKHVEKQSLSTKPSSRYKICKDDNNKEESRSWERMKNHLRGRYSTPSSQKQVVTLTITPSNLKKYILNLPKQFLMENSMLMPGMVNLCGKDGTKWLTILRQEQDGRMCLFGNGWKEFAEANNLKPGDSLKLKLIWEDATPMLSLVCSEANEKEPIPTQPRRRDSSSAIQNRFVTLTLTPEDVRACKLNLPSESLKANGINKLGKITIVGKNKTEWLGYLMSRDGTIALGIGWVEFCEANGVKLGESFTLEFINEPNTTPVLKFSSQKTN